LQIDFVVCMAALPSSSKRITTGGGAVLANQPGAANDSCLAVFERESS